MTPWPLVHVGAGQVRLTAGSRPGRLEEWHAAPDRVLVDRSHAAARRLPMMERLERALAVANVYRDVPARLPLTRRCQESVAGQPPLRARVTGYRAFEGLITHGRWRILLAAYFEFIAASNYFRLP
jgi:hypothetical protein